MGKLGNDQWNMVDVEPLNWKRLWCIKLGNEYKCD